LNVFERCILDRHSDFLRLGVATSNELKNLLAVLLQLAHLNPLLISMFLAFTNSILEGGFISKFDIIAERRDSNNTGRCINKKCLSIIP
jgi:hypothetical protein